MRLGPVVVWSGDSGDLNGALSPFGQANILETESNDEGLGCGDSRLRGDRWSGGGNTNNGSNIYDWLSTLGQ